MSISEILAYNELIQYDGQWLTLEDQLAMAEIGPDTPWQAGEIAEIRGKIAARDAKLAALAA